jgi:hypothetical protein
MYAHVAGKLNAENGKGTRKKKTRGREFLRYESTFAKVIIVRE